MILSEKGGRRRRRCVVSQSVESMQANPVGLQVEGADANVEPCDWVRLLGRDGHVQECHFALVLFGLMKRWYLFGYLDGGFGKIGARREDRSFNIIILCANIHLLLICPVRPARPASPIHTGDRRSEVQAPTSPGRREEIDAFETNCCDVNLATHRFVLPKIELTYLNAKNKYSTCRARL